MDKGEAGAHLGEHLGAGLADPRARRIDVLLGLEDLLVVCQCQINAFPDGQGKRLTGGGLFYKRLVLRQVRLDSVHGLLHRRAAD